jgi:hypothetical protein
MGSTLREDVLRVVRKHAKLINSAENSFKFNLKSETELRFLPDSINTGTVVVSLQHQELKDRGIKFIGDSALYIRSYRKSDFEGFGGFLALIFLKQMHYYELAERVPDSQMFSVHPLKFKNWEELFHDLGFEATESQVFKAGTKLNAPSAMVRLFGRGGDYALECNNCFAVIEFLNS